MGRSTGARSVGPTRTSFAETPCGETSTPSPTNESRPTVRTALDALDSYPAFFAYNANVDAIASATPAVSFTLANALDDRA